MDTRESMGMDAMFPFRCHACGQCCAHIQGTPLKSYDVYKLSRRLGKSPAELVGPVLNPVDAGFMPLPTLKTATGGFCVLLRGSLCSVHADKPLVCRMFPVEQERRRGRYAYRFTPDEEERCGVDRKVVLREWLAAVGEEELRFSRLYDDLHITLGKALRGRPLPDDQMKALGGALFTTVFLEYDPRKAYEPQFRRNAEASAMLL